MGNQLSITNIINVSVSATPTGLTAPNPSNVALFSDEVPSPLFADGYRIYRDPTEVLKDFGTSSVTAQMAVAAFSQEPNMLANGGYLVVFLMDPSETLADAITRTQDVVAYSGIASTWIENEADTLAAAAIAQALNKLIYFAQRDPAEVTPSTGILWKIKDAGLTMARGLLYCGQTDLSALLFKAAYMGRGQSTVFSGSNTTQTMQLKALATIPSDPGIDQTIFEAAKVAGADTYVSFEGVAAIYSTGANMFYDQVYNRLWFITALQTAGFNYLRQVATKVPQTENGMDGLKGAYRTVCEQAVTNQFAAPGKWTSPTTFGVQEDLLTNVASFGYYIYSQPISTQLQVDREERKAPLVQIALKEAGAIHSSNVIVNVNS